MAELIKCDECKGTGLIITPRDQSPPKLRWYYCKKCKGTGIVNWLEHLFKKTRTTKEERKLREDNIKEYLTGKYNE
jgi:DnaJ-class molecular chaperone